MDATTPDQLRKIVQSCPEIKTESVQIPKYLPVTVETKTLKVYVSIPRLALNAQYKEA